MPEARMIKRKSKREMTVVELEARAKLKKSEPPAEKLLEFFQRLEDMKEEIRDVEKEVLARFVNLYHMGGSKRAPMEPRKRRTIPTEKDAKSAAERRKDHVHFFPEDEEKIRATIPEVLGVFVSRELFPPDGYLVVKALQHLLEERSGFHLADRTSARRVEKVAEEALSLPLPKSQPSNKGRATVPKRRAEEDQNQMYG